MDRPRPTFQIILTALDDPVPAAVRLRIGLKRLLRSHRLKCTSAVELPPAVPQPAAAEARPG